MRITILCSSAAHPINAHLQAWIATHQDRHQISLLRKKTDLEGGDLLLLISCSEVVTMEERLRYGKTLVIHASDLPQGRGWSPHIWQILDGATEITVTLLEAEDKVDSGAIWKKIRVPVEKNALWDEINGAIFDAELVLMDFAVENLRTIQPMPQSTTTVPTYYPKRTPSDSRVDPKKSIEAQFDLMRACDPDRFPAYFELHGSRYIIKLEKA
jgi:methionyl-tRNA formyltransferase